MALACRPFRPDELRRVRKWAMPFRVLGLLGNSDALRMVSLCGESDELGRLQSALASVA